LKFVKELYLSTLDVN